MAGPKRQRNSKPSLARRVGRGLYRALVAAAAVIVGVWTVWLVLSQKPSTAAEPPPAAGPSVAAAGPAEAPAALQRREDTWTFLLCAEDQVSGSTDTIRVCTYDTVDQPMGLVSLPRDTLVDRRVGPYHYHKLNAACSNGDLAHPPGGGIAELMDAVGELLGIPIDHYVRIDTEIFVALVDAVGGVDFDVPVHMSYDAPDQDLHIHFEPGLQHLTGQQALEVVRCRKNSDGPGEYPHNLYDAYPDADIGRTRTQQAMVEAIAKKVLANPQKVGTYVELFSQYVETDLTPGNLLWFADPALHFDFSRLTTATLPGDGSVTYDGVTSCYALDVQGTLDIINACLNPYTTPVTEDMVHIIQPH